jgi:hydroxymethylpyrimidine/phosphomethylpyrimidine kinase
VTAKPARILIIAGSDSSGGAGIQADIKTAAALGCYAMTAVTAVTVQDTSAVHAIHPIPPELVRAQIRACLDDIGADAIKTGMLGSAETVAIVAETLEKHAKGIPLVVDPVLASTSGTEFLDDAAIEVLKERLFPIATLTKPNVQEAAILFGSVLEATLATRDRYRNAMLVTGDDTARDVIMDDLSGATAEALTFTAPRLVTRNTHGTGCTLATAIACGLGQGMSIAKAVERAHAFVQEAIRTAPGFGRGYGPLNHMHGLKR